MDFNEEEWNAGRTLREQAVAIAAMKLVRYMGCNNITIPIGNRGLVIKIAPQGGQGSAASWLSETISDLEKQMDEDYRRADYTTEQAAYDGGMLRAYLNVGKYLSEQMESK